MINKINELLDILLQALKIMKEISTELTTPFQQLMFVKILDSFEYTVYAIQKMKEDYQK